MNLHRNKPVRASRDVCVAILAASRAYPDQRVAQLIVNATGQRDPFYVEDDELIDALQVYAARKP